MNGILKSPIFKGIQPEEIESLLEGKCRALQYRANDVVALQGDSYHSLFMVESGTVRAEMTSPAGDRVVIEKISAPRAIAPAILFATENRLPVDVIAVTNVEIVAIKIGDFTTILQSSALVLHNFIRSISDRSKFLSDRVRMLRFGTIKGKLASYLLEQMQHQGTPQFTIPHTHQELADIFGVTRPALSRAVGQLAEEGVIESEKNSYAILNQEKLSDYSYELQVTGYKL